jgi:hypothetical protein
VPSFRLPDHADGPLQNAPLPNLNLPVNIQHQGPRNGSSGVPITNLNTACNYYYFFVIQVCYTMLTILVPAVTPGQHISINSHLAQLDYERGLILNVVGDVIPLSPFSSGTQPTVDISHSNDYVLSSHLPSTTRPLASSQLTPAIQPFARAPLPSATRPLASSHLTPAIQSFARAPLPSATQPLATSQLTPVIQPFASMPLPSATRPLASSHLRPAIQPLASSHLPPANQVLGPPLTWENPVSHIQKYVLSNILRQFNF